MPRRYGYRPIQPTQQDQDKQASPYPTTHPLSVLPAAYVNAGVKPGDIAEVFNGVQALGTVEVLDPDPKWPGGVHLKILTSRAWYAVGYQSTWSQLTYRVLP